MRRVYQFLAVAVLVAALLHLSAPVGRAQVYLSTYYSPKVVYAPPYAVYQPTLVYPTYNYYAGIGYTTSYYGGYTYPRYGYSPGYVGYTVGFRTLNPTVQIGMPGYLLPSYSSYNYYRSYRYSWR